MKQIFVLFFLLWLVTSCTKYAEPSLLSLSGEYRVDKITYEQTDNTTNSNNMVFYPGDMYINPNDQHPFDTIPVGFYKLHFDYSIVSFSPNQNMDGSTTWSEQYFYHVHNQTTQYAGDLEIEMNGSKRMFSIIEDGLEHIVIRSKGAWFSGSSGPNESITLFLSRTGP